VKKEKCSHLWKMVNVASGLVVMKKCFHCGKISTCFTYHDKPPLETCHEEDHFWNFMEGDPAFHFDLKCAKCDTLLKFDELVGLGAGPSTKENKFPRKISLPSKTISASNLIP